MADFEKLFKVDFAFGDLFGKDVAGIECLDLMRRLKLPDLIKVNFSNLLSEGCLMVDESVARKIFPRGATYITIEIHDDHLTAADVRMVDGQVRLVISELLAHHLYTGKVISSNANVKD